MTPALGAQERPGVELRGGAAVPLGGFEEELAPGSALSAGASFAVHVFVPRGARGALLAGFGQHRFRCTETGCGGAGDFVATAWSLGTRIALRDATNAPWVRLVMLFDRSEWAFPEDPERTRASYLSLGGELGFGLTVPIRDRLTFVPGVRYGIVNKRFPDQDPVLMQYLLADVGMVFGF
jgi:hypothetical protein